MTAKSKLAICVALLVLMGSGLALYKSCWLGVPFWKGEQVHEWQIEAKVSFFASRHEVYAKLALPKVSDRDQVGGSGPLGYHYFLQQDQQRLSAVWSAKERQGPQSLYLWVRVSEDEAGNVEPVSAARPDPDVEYLTGTPGVASKAVIERVSSQTGNPDALFVAVFSEVNAEEPSQEIMLLKRRYEKEYRDDGKVMLGIQLLRMAGLPARLAHGVMLREERGFQSPLLLVEYHDGDHWKVRNPVEPEVVPGSGAIHVWNRGGGPLLEVTGGEDSGVVFSVARERIPQSKLTDLQDSPLWISTILGLPQAERAVFRYLVLIPLGAFVVVLLRNLIGVPTLGTFMPVLIALALLEIPLVRGLVMFSVLVAVGLWFRFLLSRLNLLVVPRVAACVVIVTLLMILMSVISYRLGFSGVVQITLFPMIILAWTIERMSIIWEEEGKHSALVQVGGSLVVAVVAFLFMKIGQIQYWAFYFPELLLVMLAGILLMGRYTGYRLTELARFKNFQTD